MNVKKIGTVLCSACAIALCAWLYAPDELLDAVFAEKNAQQILIIDAGHGGIDGGAQSADGTTEQQLNLQIARRTWLLSGFLGEPAILSRETEDALDFTPGLTIRENKVADIKARQRLAEGTDNAVFLSIHLNTYQDARYFGAQTFYSRNHEDSKRYAEAIQSALVQGIQNGNERTAKPAPASVYLMQKLTCPALIVECGFLSNDAEAAALQEAAYQKRLALCMMNGYLGA